MRGEEIFSIVERTKDLEDKSRKGLILTESEVIEYNKIKQKTQIFSLEDIKEYHSYVRTLLRNVSEVKEELLKQFNETCSPGSFEIIKSIVENVCDNNLYLKGMWGEL